MKLFAFRSLTFFFIVFDRIIGKRNFLTIYALNTHGTNAFDWIFNTHTRIHNTHKQISTTDRLAKKEPKTRNRIMFEIGRTQFLKIVLIKQIVSSESHIQSYFYYFLLTTKSAARKTLEIQSMQKTVHIKHRTRYRNIKCSMDKRDFGRHNAQHFEAKHLFYRYFISFCC